MRRCWERAVGGVAFALGVVLVASDVVHWRAARRFLPSGTDRTTGPGDDLVLVLGFPSRVNGLHPMQRWRIDVAVRSMERSRGVLLISGGSRKHGRCETDDMAAYARESHGVPAERVLLERRACSTWKNVEYCLPLLQETRTVIVASPTLHAAQGRSYILAQAPGLAGHLRPADDHRWGERPVWKALTMAYQLLLLLRVRPPPRSAGRPSANGRFLGPGAKETRTPTARRIPVRGQLRRQGGWAVGAGGRRRR